MAIHPGRFAAGMVAACCFGGCEYIPSTARSGFVTPSLAITGFPIEMIGLGLWMAPIVLAPGVHAGAGGAPPVPPGAPPEPPDVPPEPPPSLGPPPGSLEHPGAAAIAAVARAVRT